ncbi:MAG: Asp-tRNA(Asn)/Glu-tRNA(Gln) amidotransferase subunit GatC [Candidatus Pacebacteria bacterium]|nr:Asp-tRNA(Asn)/Glu-tRNA(Gln) amidotransferase subunit GatC [Candidatus Paceibacterota bacterium]
MDEAHIEKLATLSRISLTPEERLALKEDIGAILGYVEQIQSIPADLTPEVDTLRNIMREDGEPHAPGIYTEELLAEAPKTRDNYIEVKKILDQR